MEAEIQKEMQSIIKYIREHKNKSFSPKHILATSVINILWKFTAGEYVTSYLVYSVRWIKVMVLRNKFITKLALSAVSSAHMIYFQFVVEPLTVLLIPIKKLPAGAIYFNLVVLQSIVGNLRKSKSLYVWSPSRLNIKYRSRFSL